jgi:hypothetical protein
MLGVTVNDFRELLALPDGDLGKVDPLVMNLLVAKSVRRLAGLDISRYEKLADEWAGLVRSRLPGLERFFLQTPQDWKNDVNLFRLGVLCEILQSDLGIAYREDQRDLTSVLYTEPADLFLNGVMDTRRGTCCNMAMLHVAIGRRLGWPVSLACVRSHFVCRFDDGNVTRNIEATYPGKGAFKSDPDDYLIRQYLLPAIAIASGSDLRALGAREMLGVFIGFRGRHIRDCGLAEGEARLGRQLSMAHYRDADWLQEAESDYALARHLFPNNRRLYIDAMALAIARSTTLFDGNERPGSPASLAAMILEEYGPGAAPTAQPVRAHNLFFSRVN